MGGDTMKVKFTGVLPRFPTTYVDLVSPSLARHQANAVEFVTTKCTGNSLPPFKALEHLPRPSDIAVCASFTGNVVS